MKKVIASSMVHLVCISRNDDQLSFRGFNINIDEPITPDLMENKIRPTVQESLGKDVVILNWQRYEM
jgi:hypothetical protein